MSVALEVTGPCNRCRVVNINPETAEASPQTLAALGTYRRHKGHTLFGMYLRSAHVGERLAVGDKEFALQGLATWLSPICALGPLLEEGMELHASSLCDEQDHK